MSNPNLSPSSSSDADQVYPLIHPLETLLDGPSEEIINIPEQHEQVQWRYHGDFRKTIQARDGSGVAFLQSIGFLNSGGAALGRQEAHINFVDFVVPILKCIKHRIIADQANGYGQHGHSIVDGIISMAPMNDPSIHPSLFQIVFQMVFKSVDKAVQQDKMISDCLGGPSVNLPDDQAPQEVPQVPQEVPQVSNDGVPFKTWQSQVTTKLGKLYELSAEDAQNLRMRWLCFANFDFEEAHQLASCVNRSDAAMFRNLRDLFDYMSKLVRLQNYGTYTRTEAIGLFVRIFAMKNRYTFPYYQIAEILEMTQLPQIEYFDALIELFSCWCAAVLFEYKLSTEEDQNELKQIGKKPRGKNKTKTKKYGNHDSQQAGARGQKRKTNDQHYPSHMENASSKGTQQGMLVRFVDPVKALQNLSIQNQESTIPTPLGI